MIYYENEFTPANDFCPHPEYWTSPDSEGTEFQIGELIYGLIRAIQPEFVLETGTYHGTTTNRIAEALFHNDHGEAVSIESNIDAFNTAKRNVHDYLPITLLNMNTLDYVPEQDIDFAFFDSWQEGRAQEFLRYHSMGRIKPGAIVSFHDTAPHHQVWNTVEKLEYDGYIKTITIHSPRGFTMAQVLK